MTFARVQATAMALQSSIALSATAQNNLLVVFLFQTSTGTVGDPSSITAGGTALTKAVSVSESSGANHTYAGLFFLPGIAAGITSVSLSSSYDCLAVEYSGAAVSNPLDVTGSATYTSGTSLSASTSSAVAAAGELACSVYGEFITSAKVTLFAGSGFAPIAAINNNIKSTTHCQGDDDLSAGSGTVTDAATTSAGPILSGSSVIATFKPAPLLPLLVTGGLVRRRTPFRAAWAGFVSRTANLQPGNQPGGLVRRRAATRAAWAGFVSTTANLQPGNQPGGLVRRRTAGRASWAGFVSRTANQAAAVLSASTPLPVIQPRRYPSRGTWRGTVSSTVNANVIDPSQAVARFAMVATVRNG